MIECRYCSTMIRTTPERSGSRCPRCRQPLFERNERNPGKETDVGWCTTHPDVAAVATCDRCGQPQCGVCRVRWFGEVLCSKCVAASLAKNETNPRQLQSLGVSALWSFLLALAGWIIVLAVLLPAVLRENSSSGATMLFLIGALVSLLPALLALGQGCAVVLLHGPRSRLAASGMILSASHLGLLVGLVFLNLWHN